MPDAPISILTNALAYEERAIAQIKEHIESEQRILHQHKKALREIRKRLGLKRTFKRRNHRNVNEKLGIEWYTLRSVIHHNIVLGDLSQWHFRSGSGDQCDAVSGVRFYFPMLGDSVMHRMLRQLAPGVQINKDDWEIVCSDIQSTLEIARLLLEPKYVTYMRTSSRGGVRFVHSIRPLRMRIARYLGDKDGREDTDT